MHIQKIDNCKYSVVDGIGCVVGHISKLPCIDNNPKWVFNAISSINLELVEMPFITEQMKILQESTP